MTMSLPGVSVGHVSYCRIFVVTQPYQMLVGNCAHHAIGRKGVRPADCAKFFAGFSEEDGYWFEEYV